MEITLEQIEQVKDRTGVSYKEAKEALEFAGGSVVDAIIYIEENINNEYEKKESNAAGKMGSFVKETVRKGNVTKIRVYKGDDVILNIPAIIGAIATVAFPWGVIAAAVTSAATKCRVEMIKEDGSVVSVSEKAGEVVGTVKDKSGVVVDEIKTKSSTIIGNVKDKSGEFFDTAKEKGSSVLENVKEKGTTVFETVKDKSSTVIETVKDKSGSIVDTVKEKGGDFFETAKNKGTELFEAAKNKGTELYKEVTEKGNEIHDELKDEAEAFFGDDREEKILDISDIDFEESEKAGDCGACSDGGNNEQ